MSMKAKARRGCGFLGGKVRKKASAKGRWRGSGKYVMQERANLLVKEDKPVSWAEPLSRPGD
jgi:hypothetical protein